MIAVDKVDRQIARDGEIKKKDCYVRDITIAVNMGIFRGEDITT